MPHNLSRIATFARKWGVKRTSNCLLSRAFLHSLRLVYGFDSWHANAPYACREYKRQTVLLASSIKPRTVIDIGCGLGEIAARIPAAHRYGFDREEAVIKGARLLYGSKVTFELATLFDVKAIRMAVRQESIDLLIMTGWTHGIKIEDLRSGLKALNDVLPIDTILIDGLHPSRMDTRGQYHCADNLKLLGKVVKSINAGDDARELHLVKLSLVSA